MRYIRTKYGIYENKELIVGIGRIVVDVTALRPIVKQADTIEELIMPEDLVEIDHLYYERIEKDRGEYLVGLSKKIVYREDVTALFVNVAEDKQMEGKFIETARREYDKDDKGELKLL